MPLPYKDSAQERFRQATIDWDQVARGTARQGTSKEKNRGGAIPGIDGLVGERAFRVKVG